MKEGMMKHFFILFLCFFAFSLNGWANPAAVEAAIQRGIRQTLKLAGCADWLIEETSSKISQRVVYEMGGMVGMSEAHMAEELNRLLTPKNLASLVHEMGGAEGEREMVVQALKSSESSLAVGRAIIIRQFLAEISPTQASQGVLQTVWEKAKQVVTRGAKVDQDKVLDILLQKSQDPKAWTEELGALAQNKGVISAEEWVAYHSFVSPVEDLVLAQAMDTLYFRQSLAIEFWIRRPRDVQYFFDHIRGVILPKNSKDVFPIINANFSTAVLDALHPDRRAVGFWHGFPESYARDKVTYGVKSQMLRLLSIKSLETNGLLGELSYREFLDQQIKKLEEAGRFRRLLGWEMGKLKELQRQVDLLERYQNVFQGTAFDIFSKDPLAATLPLEDILEPKALKGFRLASKFGYWGKNAGLILVTALVCVMDRYFEERPEELIDPEEIDLPDRMIVKDIDLKINLVTVALQTETDSERLVRLQAYLEQLQEERKKYIQK